MNYRKILIQACICILIIFSVTLLNKSENTTLTGYYNRAKAIATYSITKEEALKNAMNFVDIAKKTPSKVASAVIDANQASKYANPIDKKSDSILVPVHSVAGGKVKAVGKDSDRGLFVEIMHEGAVSCYGQLYDVKVLPDERVKRSEIIGIYNSENKEEFFYDLKEDM